MSKKTVMMHDLVAGDTLATGETVVSTKTTGFAMSRVVEVECSSGRKFSDHELTRVAVKKLV